MVLSMLQIPSQINWVSHKRMTMWAHFFEYFRKVWMRAIHPFEVFGLKPISQFRVWLGKPTHLPTALFVHNWNHAANSKPFTVLVQV